jgi:putative ABC transport system permease protein
VIAGLGAALVFALALVLAGLSSSFQAEARRVVDAIGADTWIVHGGVDSVFTTVSGVPTSLAAVVAKEPGVRRADPIVVLHHTVRFRGVRDVNVVGYVDGGLGAPVLRSGRLPTNASEIVMDESLGAHTGTRLPMGGSEFVVVGVTRGMTITAGQPMAFLRLADAQHLFVGGASLATAIVTRGIPAQVPAGFDVRSKATTKQDLLRPVAGALQSIRLVLVLLWCVAGLVVGSVVYLSALERGRDFAVYKATGWSTRTLATGLALQAMLLSLLAALVGLILAEGLFPLFPFTFELSTSARVMLPVIGVGVGLLASAAGLRKTMGVDPALALGGH